MPPQIYDLFLKQFHIRLEEAIDHNIVASPDKRALHSSNVQTLRKESMARSEVRQKSITISKSFVFEFLTIELAVIYYCNLVTQTQDSEVSGRLKIIFINTKKYE